MEKLQNAFKMDDVQWLVTDEAASYNGCMAACSNDNVRCIHGLRN